MPAAPCQLRLHGVFFISYTISVQFSPTGGILVIIVPNQRPYVNIGRILRFIFFFLGNTTQVFKI
jgi:hypothetical protein